MKNIFKSYKKFRNMLLFVDYIKFSHQSLDCYIFCFQSFLFFQLNLLEFDIIYFFISTLIFIFFIVICFYIILFLVEICYLSNLIPILFEIIYEIIFSLILSSFNFYFILFEIIYKI
jgi:hypothetical protein